MVLNFRHFYIVWLLLFICQTSFAQDADKTVTITVSGSGNTQEEAKQIALRSAIEQAFGTFISSKTEVLNDQSVSDEITSVTNGNIQNYTIINAAQLPDSTWGLTLKAVVSIDKLTKFVQAKGITIQIKGGLFALNIKQQILNEQAEIKAIYSLVGILHEPMQQSFDYVIKSSEPKALDVESKNWEIPLVVTATANKNMDFCANYFYKTLSSIGLSAEEVASYKSLNKPVYCISINFKGQKILCYLRKQLSVNLINSFTNNWEFYCKLFKVSTGFDVVNSEFNGEYFQFSKINNQTFDNYNTIINDLVVNLPSNGQQVATFTLNDKRSLDQIEQISSYTVKPKGIISKFKYGGYLIFESDGVGLVASLCDLGRLDHDSALIRSNNINFGGFSDWTLPSVFTLKDIFNYFSKEHFGGFSFDRTYNHYWSSSKATFNNSMFGILDFYKGQNTFEYNNEHNFVRPVRQFFTDGGKFDISKSIYKRFLRLTGGELRLSDSLKNITYEYEVKGIYIDNIFYDIKYSVRFFYSNFGLIKEIKVPKFIEQSDGTIYFDENNLVTTEKYIVNFITNKNIGFKDSLIFNLTPDAIANLSLESQFFTHINYNVENASREFLNETIDDNVLLVNWPSGETIEEYYNNDSGFLNKIIYNKSKLYEIPFQVSFNNYKLIDGTTFKVPFYVSFHVSTDKSVIYKLKKVVINNKLLDDVSYYDKL